MFQLTSIALGVLIAGLEGFDTTNPDGMPKEVVVRLLALGYVAPEDAAMAYKVLAGAENDPGSLTVNAAMTALVGAGVLAPVELADVSSAILSVANKETATIFEAPTQPVTGPSIEQGGGTVLADAKEAEGPYTTEELCSGNDPYPQFRYMLSRFAKVTRPAVYAQYRTLKDTASKEAAYGYLFGALGGLLPKE